MRGMLGIPPKNPEGALVKLEGRRVNEHIDGWLAVILDMIIPWLSHYYPIIIPLLSIIIHYPLFMICLSVVIQYLYPDIVG